MNLLDVKIGTVYQVDKTCEVEKFTEIGLYPKVKIKVVQKNKFGLIIEVGDMESRYGIKEERAKCIIVKEIVDKTFPFIWNHLHEDMR
jgi:Fe2+ transport system protein FeoA